MSVYVGIDVHRKRSQVAVVDAAGEVLANRNVPSGVRPILSVIGELRNRVHAVLAGHGHGRPAGCWTGPGRQWLATLELPAVSREVIDDALALMDALQQPIDRLDQEVRQRAKADPRVRVLTQLPGVGPFTALVLLAETGDISRFSSARKLASWAGLTPTGRGSDRTVHHGHISKQGPTWVRRVTCEGSSSLPMIGRARILRGAAARSRPWAAALAACRARLASCWSGVM
jgi:transposase